MSFSYKYPRPAVAVDCVIFGYEAERETGEENALRVLLIERLKSPFKGEWALPGGFVHLDETLDEAAARELREETGVSGAYIEQLYTFGAIDRDPRERVISVVYFALVNFDKRRRLTAGTDASAARWFALNKPPALAFDHERILKVAVERLRAKVRYQPIGFELLPDEFTLGELQTLYEVILERSFDKRNFRKKIESYDLLIETGGMRRGKPHRAAKLYRFDSARYKELQKHGFLFEL